MPAREPKVFFAVRAHPSAVEQLKVIRAEMQARTPYGTVTMADAFDFCVGSVSVVAAEKLEQHAWPPGRRG